jgi:DNA topoisomerase IB
VARLKRSDPSTPGIARQRRGRGFCYRLPSGRPVVDRETLDRIHDLVLPPAWNDVWICLDARGHIQAVGSDAAGRRQYRYHDEWRNRRDRAKHRQALDLGRSLPALRAQVSEQLSLDGLPRERVLAAAVRLLDIGFFRVGSESYARENGTFGLATLRKDHVTVRRDGGLVFRYTAKGGQNRSLVLHDPEASGVVSSLRRRRGGGPRLLAWRDRRLWRGVTSADINGFLQESTGLPVTAKDFRTWHATVLAAVALAVADAAARASDARPRSAAARNRVVVQAVREVSHHLGNTPAVCRRSYIDPRIVDLYHDGITIAPVLPKLGADSDAGDLATVGAVERAVLRLLAD